MLWKRATKFIAAFMNMLHTVRIRVVGRLNVYASNEGISSASEREELCIHGARRYVVVQYTE